MDTLRRVAEFAGIDTKIYNDQGEPIEPKNPDILRIKLLEPEGSMAIMGAFLSRGIELITRTMSSDRSYVIVLLKEYPHLNINWSRSLPKAILFAAEEFVKEEPE